MNELLGRILTVNLIGTTVVFYVAARIYLVPRLPDLNPRRVLLPILLMTETMFTRFNRAVTWHWIHLESFF